MQISKTLMAGMREVIPTFGHAVRPPSGQRDPKRHHGQRPTQRGPAVRSAPSHKHGTCTGHTDSAIDRKPRFRTQGEPRSDTQRHEHRGPGKKMAPLLQ